MLTVTLTEEDLRRVHVLARPLPLTELQAILRNKAARSLDIADPRLSEAPTAVSDALDQLMNRRVGPGFLCPVASDPDEALEMVARTPRSLIAAELQEMAAIGTPMPSWTRDLVRPGQSGVAARRFLRDVLADGLRRHVKPLSEQFQPTLDDDAKRLRVSLERGSREDLFNSLEQRTRLEGNVLSVDLMSGANVNAKGAGAGIILVPRWSSTPSITVSADGTTPVVLSHPITVPQYLAAELMDRGQPHLARLMGPTRTALLRAVVAQPGASVSELAATAEISLASVSEHARVLREAGLLHAQKTGRRTTHLVTDLGRLLIARAAAATS